MAQNLGNFERVLRVGEGRRLKRLQSQAEYVGTLEPEFEKLSDEQLGEAAAESYVVQAERLDADLWEVRVATL